MLYRGPNAHLVSRALLKLESYLTMQINKSCESASRLKVRVESEFFEWKLPRDVIKIIMLFVDPFVLIALGSTCHSLYKESLRSEYWESSTKDYIHQLGLDFTGVHAKCLREKEAFIWIYQHTSIILDLMQNFNILKKKRIDEQSMILAKNSIEHIFEKKFDISSPWLHTLRDRIQRELINAPKEMRVVSIDDYLVEVTMDITSGFYKGDSISFQLLLNDDYPQSEPIIRCLSSVSHPYIIDQNGLFQLPRSKHEMKHREALTVVEILKAIHEAFIDCKVITNSIDF